MKYAEVSVSNNGGKTFSQPKNLIIANTNCQILENNGSYTLKVIIQIFLKCNLIKICFKNGTCNIDNACYNSGDINPVNYTLICNPEIDKYSWISKAIITTTSKASSTKTTTTISNHDNEFFNIAVFLLNHKN